MHENFDKLFNKLRYEKDNLFLYNKRFKISIIVYSLIKLIETSLLVFIISGLIYIITYDILDIFMILKLSSIIFSLNVIISFNYIYSTFNLCIKSLDKKDLVLLKNNECFKKYKIPRFIYNMLNLKPIISDKKEICKIYKMVIDNIILAKWVSESDLDSKVKTKMLKFLADERKTIKEKLTKSDSNTFENAIKYDNLNSFIDKYDEMNNIIQTSNLFKTFNSYLIDYVN